MAVKTAKFKSKKFRIAKEGLTTDGRKISREWLEQMATNYNQNTYGARINLEHIRGVVPDSPFKAYGDVLALETEEENNTLYLLASIDPTDECVELNKKRQKVFTSMEVDTDFAGTGQAYLVGLALTDSPASLGTEMLQFSATAKHNPLADRKQKQTNLFSESFETAITFTEAKDDNKNLLAAVREMFTKNKSDNATSNADMQEMLINALSEFSLGIKSEYCSKQQLTEAIEQHGGLQASFNKLKDAHDALILKLSSEEESGHSMPPADGNGDNYTQTDC